MAIELDIEIGQTFRSRSGIYYRNIQRLGAGGNSIVYLVIALNKSYRGVLFALKIFTRLSDAQRLGRFQREAEFLRECEHPAIMRIYDDGTYPVRRDEGTTEFPFVVAEYLPNTLHDTIRTATTTVERLSYTLQILSALQYLSEHNPPVAHRDIKPQNIFVKGRSCVLGDFGLMKFLDNDDEIDREIFSESTGPGMPRFYRTPDLVAYGKREALLTAKSDVFQFGLVVAEMFTRRNPCKRSADLLLPVELESIGDIPGIHNQGIRMLIERMLDFNISSRPAASDLIDQWDGFFRAAVTQCHQLDGRVF